MFCDNVYFKYEKINIYIYTAYAPYNLYDLASKLKCYWKYKVIFFAFCLYCLVANSFWKFYLFLMLIFTRLFNNFVIYWLFLKCLLVINAPGFCLVILRGVGILFKLECLRQEWTTLFCGCQRTYLSCIRTKIFYTFIMTVCTL